VGSLFWKMLHHRDIGESQGRYIFSNGKPGKKEESIERRIYKVETHSKETDMDRRGQYSQFCLE
jgi:hypothetical protein